MESVKQRGFDNSHTLIFIRATPSSPHISIGNMIGSGQSASDYCGGVDATSRTDRWIHVIRSLQGLGASDCKRGLPRDQ